MRKPKVLLDVRHAIVSNGGVHQAALGLARVLGELDDFAFYWLTSAENKAEFSAVVKGSHDLIVENLPESYFKCNPHFRFIGRLRDTRIGDLALVNLRKFGPFRFQLSSQPSIVSKINPAIIHFSTQVGFKTNIRNVYQPHDIQHINLPMNFTKEQLYLRRIVYNHMLRQSTNIIVGNQWTRDNILEFFPQLKGQIEVVPVFSENLIDSFKDESAQSKSDSHQPVILYPSAAWKHKNHERLILAFRLLLKKGVYAQLLLVGLGEQDLKVMSRKNSDLISNGRLVIKNRVSKEELDIAYRLATIVVVPSEFESESLPIWESFIRGIPVAASRIESIVDQAGEAAAYFDPKNHEQLALTIKKVLEDKTLKRRLVEAGRRRAKRLSIDNSRLGMRYVYRKTLQLSKDEGDIEWEKNGFRF